MYSLSLCYNCINRRASTDIKTPALKRDDLELTHTLFYLSLSSFMHHQLPIQLISMLMWNDIQIASYCTSIRDGAILYFLCTHGRQHILLMAVGNEVPWLAWVWLHKCRFFTFSGNSWCEKQVQGVFFQVSDLTWASIGAANHINHRNQKDMCPQDISMVGKEEEQRSFNAIKYPTLKLFKYWLSLPKALSSPRIKAPMWV